MESYTDCRMRQLLTSLILLGGCLATAQNASPGSLTIRFFDVGQGDAILITAPEGQTLLYDGGRSEARMRELIRQYNINRIDVVVASHADSDHITGLIPAVALFKPMYFINNGLAGDTVTWGRLVNVAALAETKGLIAQDQVINLGSVKVTVIPPPPGMPAEQNLNSVGLLVQYGTFKALMTGDSEHAETQGWLKKYPALGPVDVYKAIHHGSLNGDTLAWLRSVQPKNVVVSVGPNTYGHPTAQALTLYRLSGANTYRTDLNGTVTVQVQPSGQYSITTERGTDTPGRAPAVTPAPSTPVIPQLKTPSPAPAYYRTCAEARAAGAAPLLRGQPGYRPELDRDGDGRACE